MTNYCPKISGFLHLTFPAKYTMDIIVITMIIFIIVTIINTLIFTFIIITIVIVYISYSIFCRCDSHGPEGLHQSTQSESSGWKQCQVHVYRLGRHWSPLSHLVPSGKSAYLLTSWMRNTGDSIFLNFEKSQVRTPTHLQVRSCHIRAQLSETEPISHKKTLEK